MDDNSLPLDLRVPKKKLVDEEHPNVSENQDDNKAIESASAAQSFDNSGTDNLEIVDNEIETEQHEVDPEGETSQGEKLLVCPTCSKTFKGRNLNYRLKSHMITHTSDKPFKCKFCDYACARAGDLAAHERTHTGDKPFKCKFCDYASAYAGDLVRHKRTHTGDKPFKCEICDYASAQAGDLVRHKRIHTGEQPYQCPECDDRFTRSDQLHEHMKCCTGTESAEAGPSTSSSNQKDN